ncbi:HEPN domain-containing protein [candidate division KSB1 bacterium]|nr:HEPN domain-containing protein [candidate division KSB1 bacterium]
MDTHRVIRSWRESADKDWEVAQSLFKLKHYAYSLFFCHLVVEKLLKALVVQKTGEQAPTIHDLIKLVKKTGLKPTQAQREQLEVITTFNIKARYDDVKQSFYKQATRDFAQEHMKITKEICTWLKGNLQ